MSRFTRPQVRKVALRLLLAAVVLAFGSVSIAAVFEVGAHDPVALYLYLAELVVFLLACGAVLCFIGSFLFPRGPRVSIGCEPPAAHRLRALKPQRTERRGRDPLEAQMLDEDLAAWSREQLVEEVRRLRSGIREHRDSSGQELCWHHPKLWGLLPEKTDPVPAVPAWPQFLQGCVRYRQSLDEQLPDAPRTDDEYG
jgi:hypothetical protein